MALGGQPESGTVPANPGTKPQAGGARAVPGGSAQPGAVPAAQPVLGPDGSATRWPTPPGVLLAPPSSNAPINRIQGRWRYGWIWAAIWLVYLINPLQQAWRNDDPLTRALGVSTISVFAVCFVVLFQSVRTMRRRGRQLSPTRRWSVLAVLLALIAAATPATGQVALGMLTYVVVAAFFTLPTRSAMLFVAGLIAATVVLPYLIHSWEPAYTEAFTIFVTSVAMWGIVQMIERNAQLAEAHEEIARLAVANERNRFARDLHDLLGHSLTIITVKAELAGRLLPLAPERAGTEIADMERIAREALQDVRSAVTGYREVSLAGELVSARTALSAAGIEADLPATVSQVPADLQETFGWVVREGVTNVIRHSGAKRCRIRVTAREVEIVDDGRGPARPVAASPANRTGPADGTRPADRTGPADGTRPADRTGPADGTRPADGTGPTDGTGPADGTGDLQPYWPDSPAGGHEPGSGHGLAGLRERAAAVGASLSVGHAAEGGFALRVRVP